MTQSVISNALLLSIHTIFSINLVQSDTAVIHCPDIAFLGTSARLTCSTPVDFFTTSYSCPCGLAPQCQAESGCTNVSGYNASIVNQTQTELTIISVQPQHAGNWSCVDRYCYENPFCHLVVAKIPSVNITSDVDADSVNLGDRISLTVDIRDYHCSDTYNLTLQVGSVTYTSGTGRNATIKYLPKIVPINVTQTHFGDVKLVFACGNHQWNITPEGVNELLQNRTNIPTTLSTGSLTAWSPPTPSDTSTLFIVAGGVTSIVIMNMIITFACSYKWKKQVKLRQLNILIDPPYITVEVPANRFIPARM
ncbi:uncharacterized protein [Haliotis cracherodii]|uniref:uncharacterized protein n=1 Tax=Haliotis cracherodii TaxID=6455 RepID=UPI0039EC3EB3